MTHLLTNVMLGKVDYKGRGGAEKILSLEQINEKHSLD